MSLRNNTPHSALAVPTIAPDGRAVVVVLVKAAFVQDEAGRLVPAEAQVPVWSNDVPHDPEASESSVRYPSDVGTEKHGGDLVVVGEAISDRPVRSLDLGVSLRGKTVALRVHGERLYYQAAAHVAVGPAAPFERKAVIYEHAYGGATADAAHVERRNPVGRGMARSAADLAGKPAPIIEDPAAPVTSAGDRPEPAGYGAMASHWLPRAAFAGTFDQAWQHDRMPLLPRDFDRRYHNVAHPRLQVDTPFRTGERIAVSGMSEPGRRAFVVELPRFAIEVMGLRHDGEALLSRPPVDLVLLEPGPGTVVLLARAVLPTGRGKTLLREVRVDVA